jgi:hypothetical protein
MCLTPSPRQTGRVGVRGKYLKIKRLLTLPHSSIGYGGKEEKPNYTTTPFVGRFPIAFPFFNFSCVHRRARALIFTVHFLWPP